MSPAGNIGALVSLIWFLVDNFIPEEDRMRLREKTGDLVAGGRPRSLNQYYADIQAIDDAWPKNTAPPAKP